MSGTSKPSEGDPSDEREKIHFHYIKANHFRVVHADGVHGGVTPRGYIQMNFYSERSAIPKVSVYAIADGKLAEEIREERIQRDGPVREVEVGVVMDLPLAKSFLRWLKEKIDALEPEIEGSKTE